MAIEVLPATEPDFQIIARPLQKSSESYDKLTRRAKPERPSMASSANQEADRTAANQALTYIEKRGGSVERQILQSLFAVDNEALPEDLKQFGAAGLLELNGVYTALTGGEINVEPETLKLLQQKKISPQLAHFAGQMAGGFALMAGAGAALGAESLSAEIGSQFYRHPQIARFLAPAAGWGASSGGASIVQEGIKQVRSGDIDFQQLGRVVLSQTATGAVQGALTEGFTPGSLRIAGAAAFGFGIKKMEGASLSEAALNSGVMALFAASSSPQITEAQKEGAYRTAVKNVEESIKSESLNKGYSPAESEKLAQAGSSTFRAWVEEKGGVNGLTTKDYDAQSKEIWGKVSKTIDQKPSENLLESKPELQRVSPVEEKINTNPEVISKFVDSFPTGDPGVSRETKSGTAGQFFVYRDEKGTPKGVLHFDDTPGSENLGVVVHPDAQRQGIATQLYDAAAEDGIPVTELAKKGKYTESGAKFIESYQARVNENLKQVRDEIASGEAGQRLFVRDSDGYLVNVQGVGSTFPDYFKNKGVSKGSVLNLIDKRLAGEELTPNQSNIIASLVSERRRMQLDTATRVNSEQIKAAPLVSVGDLDLIHGDKMKIVENGKVHNVTVKDKGNGNFDLVNDITKKVDVFDQIKVLEMSKPKTAPGAVSSLIPALEKFYHGTTSDVSSVPPGAFLTNDPNEAALYANMRARQKGLNPKIIEVPASSGIQNESVVKGHLRASSEITGRDVTELILAKDDSVKTPILASEVIPGSKKFIEQDVAPAIKAAGEAVKKIGDEIQTAMAPVTRSQASRLTAGVVRENAAQLARKKEIAFSALEKASKVFDKLAKETNYQFIDSMEAGQPQSVEELQPVANELRKMLDSRREQIQSLGTGKLEHFIQDYFPHLWKDPAQAENIFARIFGKRPLEGSKSFLRKRTIPTFKEGIESGLEPVSDNPVELVLLKVAEMDRYIMGQQIFSELKDKGLAKFVRSGTSAPNDYSKIDDKIARVLQYSEAEGGFIQRGEYWAPEPVAKIVNNYLSPGLRGKAWYNAIRSSGNLLNQVQLGMSAFHLGFTALDSLVSSAALGIQQLSRGELSKGVLSIASSMDIVTHPIRTYLKGDKLFQEYLNPGSQGEEIGQIIDSLIAAGGRVKMDSFYKNSSVESFWKALRSGNYPGAALRSVPAAIEALSYPIMEKIVPRMKLGVFFDLAREELGRLPKDVSREQFRDVMGKAWDSVDNRLGQLVYDNLFWDRTLKDLGLLSVRSLGWNLGTFRELGGGIFFDTPEQIRRGLKGNKPEVTSRMAYAIALPFVVGVFGAIYQYLMTGEKPKEKKDYYFPRNGKINPNGNPERVSLPSYMKDLYAYHESPLKTVSHKLHPLFSIIADMLRNKDFYGVQIRNESDSLVQQAGEVFAYTAKQFVPFSVRNFQQRIESGGTKEQAMQSFFGITPAPASIYQSAAEKMARGLHGRTQADADKTKLLRTIENSLRGENKSTKVLDAALTSGQITLAQARESYRKAQLNSLQIATKRLTMAELLKVVSVATPEERKSLETSVYVKFRNTSNKMTPSQIDSTLKKIEELYPREK